MMPRPAPLMVPKLSIVPPPIAMPSLLLARPAAVEAAGAGTLDDAVVRDRRRQIGIDAVAVAVDRSDAVGVEDVADAGIGAGDGAEIRDRAGTVGADAGAVAPQDRRAGLVDDGDVGVGRDAVARARDQAAGLVGHDHAGAGAGVDSVGRAVGAARCIGPEAADDAEIRDGRVLARADGVVGQRLDDAGRAVDDGERHAGGRGDRAEIERLPEPRQPGAAGLDQPGIVDEDRAAGDRGVDAERVVLRRAQDRPHIVEKRQRARGGAAAAGIDRAAGPGLLDRERHFHKYTAE